MTIPVTVPGLLADSVGGQRRIVVEAATLAIALRALQERYSNLRAHVWDENGAIRQHILIYLNDESVTWIDDHESRGLRDSDALFIIQAVSGG
ncbi:MAG: MoaD/ThiS family protein [Anaerolineae bacterium]|nr:MoaD/ThiS family protein [Phycisphaerae bacterium]